MIRDLLDSTGALLSGQSIIANFTSELVDISPWDRWGLIVKVGTVTGTDPTLDMKIQTTLDDGVSFVDAYPTDTSSGSQAALTQMVATGDDRFENWDRALPQWEPNSTEGTPAGRNFTQRIRVVGTIGGTSTPTFPLTELIIVGVRFR